MAYAYPSADKAGSDTSLVGGGDRRETTRKSSVDFDVLREIKLKIQEDDDYIMFFAERIRVEEQYIESLTRLYDRSVAIDSLHEDSTARKGRPTTRRAWHEVRDYTLREIQARSAMTGALREDVLKELVKLKEEQTRIRHGLKDNLKLASEMYEDHARSHVPKLKRTYYQKCQALEDHKRQEHAIAMQARLLATPSPPSPATTPLHEHPFSIGAGPSYTSPPTASSALPPMSNPAMHSNLGDTSAFGDNLPRSHSGTVLFSPSAIEKEREREKKSGRLRAGSASGSGDSKPKEVLNDIAAQSKKGFSAIMQKLGGDKDKDKEKEKDNNGFVVVGSSDTDGGLQRRGTAGGAAKTQGPMRSVRIKREADEADKAYRTGVFHLESLRLRREKLQTSATNSLESFNDELNSRLRRAMERYIDALHGTAATNAQATEVARSVIDEVNLEHDMMLFRTRLRSINTHRAAPVPYENFYVGPCRSLIFGVSLTDYDFARGEGGDHGRPPTIVEKCIAAIDERGLEAEGIYRVSGRHAGVQKMVQGVELDEGKFEFDEKDDVFSIGNVLKQYLRELPDPVFPLPHPERVKHTENRESHIGSNFSVLRSRLRRLAPIHQTTFQAIIEHLARVQANSSVNKMGAKNLAVVFNSVLFGQDQLTNETNVLTMHQEKDTVLEDLITYSDLLFGVESPVTAPSALPPGSALSRSGVLSYHPVHDGPQPGSSRTKVKIYQPGESPKEAAKASPTSSAELAAASAAINTGSMIMPAASESVNTTKATEDGPSLVSYPAFTPDDQLELSFDPKHIPAALRTSLPENIHIRPLSSSDLLRSHFELLNDLRSSPALAPSVYSVIFYHLRKTGTYILVMVNKETDQLVASGTLIVERKFIRSGGAAGHIEDIVVHSAMQGKKLGQKLVEGLRDVAVGLGCYKVILDCQEENIPFYQKCGFQKHSAGMAYYVPEESRAQAASSSAGVFDLSSTPQSGNSPIPPPVCSTSIPSISAPKTADNPFADQISGLNGRQQETLQGGGEGQALDIPDHLREEEESPSSPKTFASASSGSGSGSVASGTGSRVTYRFPTSVDGSSLPAWATEAQGAQGSGSSALAPPIPAVDLPTITASAPFESGSSALQGGLACAGVGENGPEGTEREGRSARSSISSLNSLVSDGDEGEGSLSARRRARLSGTASPLPPGAAPAVLTNEPEKLAT